MLKFTDKRGNTIYAYQHPAKLNIAVLEEGNPAIERAVFEHDSSVVLRPCDIECTLKSLKTSFEK